MKDAPRFETYRVAENREWMMRCGTSDRYQVIILLPFFHESNRLRTLAPTLMRLLGRRGISSVLPDLPGCGESLSPLPASLDDWREAAQAVVDATGAHAALSIRTGALIDAIVPAARRWRLTPATGPSLTRDLVRSDVIAAREDGRMETAEAITAKARTEMTRLAGYAMPPGLFAALEAAQPPPDAARTVRLDGDDRPADARIAGPMLWRQSEPEFDGVFAEAITSDFSSWLSSCADF